MKYEVIMKKGDYALILRGNELKEYAVVTGLNKEKGDWGRTSEYWSYEYKGVAMGNQALALASAVDFFRMRTEDNYIPRPRLEELATLFKDGLIEDDEESAMEYFEEVCEMKDHEKEFFGIEESEETDEDNY